MSSLGHYLEFSVRTPDIIESLGFYKLLGFTELDIGDAWTHKYAVVSDGILCIGLHDREFDAPALTFVRKNLARQVRKMTDHGFDFRELQLDDDTFNEAALVDRDGHNVRMQEARTFTGADEFDNDSICGTWFELSLPVKDAIHAARFWAAVAPALLHVREEPTVHMRFDAGGLPLGLSESIALAGPSLCFRCADRQALMDQLERLELRHERHPGYEGAFVTLRAPEGTPLYVFDEDFLGEAYEVDESGDPDEFAELSAD